MNKRGVIEDWGNLVVAIAFSIIILWFFGIAVSGDTVRKEKETKDRDEQLSREHFLITYLRTPISQTDQVIKKIPLSGQTSQSILENAVKNNLTMSDLFRLSSINPSLYHYIIGEITSHDSSFSGNEIRVNGLLLSRTSCQGKTSVAYIPIEGQNPETISVVLCKQEAQNA